jgi:hypothetical protein
MARITVVEAVKAKYTSRPTLYRAIKQGKISTQVNQRGTKTVDVADLIRQFGEPGEPYVPAEVSQTLSTAARDAEFERLKAENDQLKHEASEHRREAKDARDEAAAERNRLYGLVETSQKQIEDLSKKDTDAEKPGFFKRLFG